MRRVLVFLIAVLVCVGLGADAFAQGGQAIGFGVKGGVTFSKLRGSFLDEDFGTIDLGWDWKAGYSFGTFVNVPIQRGFSFEPEFFLTRRSSRVAISTESITIRTHYLEIPVLLKYTVQRGSSYRPVVFGGGSLAFELGSNATAAAGDVSETENISDVLRNRDFGLVFGGGLDIYHNDKVFHLEGRFTLGLTDLVTAEAEADSGRFKFSVITFLAGVTF